jgi:hypothetical protein
MSKIKGTFRFKYTELKNKTKLTSEIIVETMDVVKSIGKFGMGRTLTDLDVIKLNK